MLLRSSLSVRLAALFVLVPIAISCGGDGDPGPDPSASVRISALATEPTTLDGPEGSSLLVPAGASDEDVTVVITAPRNRRPGPAGTTTVAGQITLTPEGKEFLVPLEITITPTSLPAGKTVDDVIVVRAPQGTGTDGFVPLPTRREGNAVVAQTEHFSDYLAIVIDDPAQNPFGACTDDVCAMSESCDSCPADCGVCLVTGDVTPPVATGLSAPANTTGVRGDATISVTFDEAILAASIDGASFAVQPNGSTVLAGTFQVAGATVTFVPSAPLASDTTYEVVVGPGVRDLAGNLMLDSTKYVFTTAVGATLSLAMPSNGAIGVPQSTTFNFVFQGQLEGNSIRGQAASGPCTGSVQLSADGFATCLGAVAVVGQGAGSIAVAPAALLPSEATVAVRLTDEAHDAGGFSLASRLSYSVTVEQDTIVPTVVDITPPMNAVGVPLDQIITIVFSEPLDPTSVTPTNVQLIYDGQPVPASVSLSGSTITLTPMSPLDAGHFYNVRLRNLRDLANNDTQDTIFPYSFRAAEALVLQTSFPAPGQVGVHPSADLRLGFSFAIDAATVSMQATTSANCTGTIQVSDGTNCYGGTATIGGAVNELVVRASALPLGANITIRITTGLLHVAGLGLSSDALVGFRVSPVNGFAYRISPSGTLGADLMSAGSLDARCDPAMIGARKAFVMTASRYACSVAWCGTDTGTAADTSADWVLEPGTSYVNAAGDLIFTTDPIAPVPTGIVDLQHAFGTASSPVYFYGGAWDWRYSGNSCNEFASSSGTFSATYIDGAVTTTAGIGGWVPASFEQCGVARDVLCVDQVPGTLPATH